MNWKFSKALLPFFMLSAYILPAPAAEQPPVLRLPQTVSPTGYQAALELDPADDTFTGRIRIGVDIKQPVQTIWLNAVQLEIAHAEAEINGKKVEAKIVGGGDQFVGLGFDSPIAAGSAQLDLRYTGHVRTRDSSGIFRMEEDGNKFLFTQFESADARAAFPCFDEPSFKVPWQITLSVPQDDDVVSNTPVESERTSSNRKTTVFRQSKPLPSYLVAFAVGKFDFIPAGFAGKNRAPVRIVTPRGHGTEAKYAAEVTATILTRLEDYFDIPFPYEKSDQVAIPTTYSFGAMENAGMVTYAQNILLADPARDTTVRQRSYASVAAHELAHQWFGDLVTTAWWNDIWLNEAFATWMEQKLIAEWKPEWQTRVADVNDKLGAEAEDTLLSARKIRQEIKSMDDVSNAFDGITYQKGAAVIGMFENYVGDDAFRRGVQNYLHRYAFKNATAPDFLSAVSEGSGKNIAPPFGTFLDQPGVPLVSMSVKCGNGQPAVHLEQERSLPAGTSSNRDSAQHWQIPVCVRYAAGNGQARSACTLFADPQTDWKLETNGCPTWLDGNAKAMGYYRVAYGEGSLGKLTEGDVEHRLSAPERVDLLGNAQALADNGKMSEGDVLRLVPVFRDDPSRYVIERTIAMAGMPLAHLVPENLLPNYRRFIDQNFAERARQIGWLPSSTDTTKGTAAPQKANDDMQLLRPDLLKFVATSGADQTLADEARSLTDKWLNDRTAVPAAETSAVLQTAAYYGDKTLFDKFLATLKNTQDHQERRRILEAMFSFRDPAAIQAGMNAVLHGDIPFIQGEHLLYAGQQNESTRRLSFDFMKAHIDQLAAMRPNGSDSDAGAHFAMVGRNFCDAQSRNELKEFFEPRVKQFIGAPRVLAQTLEGIDACIARKSEQQASVESFLKAF